MQVNLYQQVLNGLKIIFKLMKTRIKKKFIKKNDKRKVIPASFKNKITINNYNRSFEGTSEHIATKCQGSNGCYGTN